jgi:hypothetical protein
VVNVHKVFEGGAVLGKSLLVVVESPAKELPHIVCDMKLDLVSIEGEPGINFFKDEGKLSLEFLPKLFVDLRNLALIVSESAAGLQLLKFLFAFEA